MFILKLPRFFTRLYDEEKRAAIKKITYIQTPLSRSYIVFALSQIENLNQNKCSTLSVEHGRNGSVWAALVQKIAKKNISLKDI